MTRVVFFSFDYDDVWRVNQVRNSGRFVGEQRSGFRDKAEYEQVKQAGDAKIREWIQRQMHGCSVTCVLIGAATHKSRWVNFEIAESIRIGMGLLGVYIHKLRKSNDAQRSVFNTHFRPSDQLLKPPNPLDKHTMPPKKLYPTKASDHFATHIWEPANSEFNWANDLGGWVEEAARRSGR